VSTSYVATTGQGEWFVRIPSLSSTANTVIYMFLGNPNAPNTAQAAATWANGYAGVYHFGTGLLVDSSPYANNLTFCGTGALTPVVGEFNVYMQFTPSASACNTTAMGLAVGNDARTIEGWYKFPSVPSSNFFLFGYGDYQRDGNFSLLANATPSVYLSAQTYDVNPTIAYTPDTNWHFLAASLPGGSPNASSVQYFLDGAAAMVCGSLGCGSLPARNTSTKYASRMSSATPAG
jgi:hypothetical protein